MQRIQAKIKTHASFGHQTARPIFGGLRPKRLALLVAATLGSPLGASADQTGKAAQFDVIEVVAPTPLPGFTQPKEQLPGAVQTGTAEDIARDHALDLTEFMKRDMPGVFVNDVQNNPLQPDLNFRGFVASPLLGTPQGLSVYMDGVRLNQPFGDVVSWDIIPRQAISSFTLVPGSNPLYGLNTLGGAISIQTKDGLSAPGSAVQVRYGSHARREVGFENGGSNAQGLNWYVTGEMFRERGWREHSESEANKLFSKLGWMDAKTSLSFTAAYADSDLTGNGFQEQRFLDRNYASSYTWPDNTKNRSIFLNLVGQHNVSDDVQLAGNVYYRDIKTSTFNGDINEAALDQNNYRPGENFTNTPFPSLRCIAEAAINGEPNEKCNGLQNHTSTNQQNWGFAGQVTLLGKLGDAKNQFTSGFGYDGSRVKFNQSAEFGYLNPDRSVTSVGVIADGTQNSENAFDSRADLTGRTHTWSLLASDTLSFSDVWHVTVAGRYNRSTVHNRDGLPVDPINPAVGVPLRGSLDGDHTFSRFNPAIGLTVVPSKAWNAYIGYNEGSRAPSSIELGCADPNTPCNLPNSMAGDPPLKQVVSKNWEAGFRGRVGAATWSAGVFRTENVDDIMFVASDQTGYGYFKNFGKTRRQGVELSLSGSLDKLHLSSSYTYLDATYRSSELVGGSSNSSNDSAQAGFPGVDGNITISPGDKIPLIPKQFFKASMDYDLSDSTSIGMDMVAMAGSYSRGNENNQHQADGVYYLGPGKTAGYSVFNISLDHSPTKSLKLFAQINNIFDRKYYTASLLGPTGFQNNGNYVARPFPADANGDRPIVHATFYSPGAPRSFWVGLRYEFGDVKK